MTRNFLHICIIAVCTSLWSSQNVQADNVRILALGDSLTAGYGLQKEEAFTTVLQKYLRAQGHDVTIINGGVSGDTSAGGLARLDWLLVDNPQIVILELGANDGLRALSPTQTRKNLTAIIENLQGKNIKILFTGMLAPPNFGKDYGAEFNSIYPDLAAQYNLAFYPFFLEGVAAKETYNQSDGIHPNGRGVEIIVENIAPYVVGLLP